jgi:hypothetical protein
VDARDVVAPPVLGERFEADDRLAQHTPDVRADLVIHHRHHPA